jgi:beta-carotene ketolase (CrtW type)
MTPLAGAADRRGVAIALAVIFAWLAVEAAGLFLLPLAGALALAPLAMFLYTGLFITAHDALHGSLAPGRPRLNRALGRAALWLYAAFTERTLQAAHARHHATPAADGDPDYARGERYLPWLAAFAFRYVRPAQLIALAVEGNVLIHLYGVRPARLIAIWVAPAVASAIQLFTFGTYLPHRAPPGGHGHKDAHRARSLALSSTWSFLTCWHFGGRHHEHHQDPSLPWWRLDR